MLSICCTLKMKSLTILIFLTSFINIFLQFYRNSIIFGIDIIPLLAIDKESFNSLKYIHVGNI